MPCFRLCFLRVALVALVPLAALGATGTLPAQASESSLVQAALPSAPQSTPSTQPLMPPPIQAQALPQTVTFSSGDGRTTLVAYLFEPPVQDVGPHPAIVLLHGRGGPYSSNVNAACALVTAGLTSACNARTLSKRHMQWGQYWADHGYVALLVDSFGPRGRAHGYGRYTHGDPDRAAVNEISVRPLDAEAALAWLAARPDVKASRVMLQGWSNGGSTALNVMERQAARPQSLPRFRAALVFYPGCGPKALMSQRASFDAPLWVFLGSADEEVSPSTCQQVLRAAQGGPISVTLFNGATHDFDDPGTSRQALGANREARAAVLNLSAGLLDRLR